MVMPKEEHNALLEQFIPKLERSNPASSGKAKIFLSGHICSRVRSDILDLIEDSGGLVVGDDLYVGARYFATEIPIDLPPMEALAKGFFNISIPCPTRAEEQEDPRRDWANYVVSNARESGAQGIICLFPKWCSYINFSLPSLRDKLAEAGIPYIILDTEHEMASLGTVKTRIAAFIEMLESKGG
jgi:benzoyl-CoA reductase subunit C